MSSSHGASGAIAGAFALGLLAIASLVLVVVVLPGGGGLSSCDDGSGTAGATLRAGSLTAEQRANAASIISEGRRRHLPDQAIVIALATASQESGFRNYANDGRGGDLRPDQRGISASLQLPHEAVGTDHGSLGLFQQQWPWWGSMRDLMTPATAADKFYNALLKIPRWQSIPVTVAAQMVQRSARPDGYADDEALARSLLRDSSTGQVTADRAVFTGTISSGCDAALASSSGGVVFPLPAGSGYVDQQNWGHRGTVWSYGHTGTDLSVACGTPVLAATGGSIIVRTDQPWAGRWLVEVSTGSGRLTTWYAHMRALNVAPGQRVTAGQQIGEVGDLGNASGCHLHFEVHPHGGSIYEDDVNPTTWLQQNVGRTLDGPSFGPSFVLATFNTLGSSHTATGGNKAWMASGPRRTQWLVELLTRHHVDVAGLQEFQRPQYRTFLRLTGSTYAIYSPRGDTENSIIWRRARWELVSATTFAIPYFDGHKRRMPIVTLRDRLNGRLATFVNVHNPADTSRFPHQGRWRKVAVSREVALVRRLQAAGTPVLLTGDMNDRHNVFCRLTDVADLRAAGDPTVGRLGRCSPSAHAQIDWIFGSKKLRMHDYVVDRRPLQEGVSDHPLVTVEVG